MNNYEYIKTLSLEDMASQLTGLNMDCVFCGHRMGSYACRAGLCTEGRILWLKDNSLTPAAASSAEERAKKMREATE